MTEFSHVFSKIRPFRGKDRTLRLPWPVQQSEDLNQDGYETGGTISSPATLTLPSLFMFWPDGMRDTLGTIMGSPAVGSHLLLTFYPPLGMVQGSTSSHQSWGSSEGSSISQARSGVLAAGASTWPDAPG